MICKVSLVDVGLLADVGRSEPHPDGWRDIRAVESGDVDAYQSKHLSTSMLVSPRRYDRIGLARSDYTGRHYLKL